MSSLDKSIPKELAKWQELYNKRKQLEQEGENQVAQIKAKAEEKQYQDIKNAELKMQEAVAQTALKSILENKNMAQAFEQVGKQMLETALTNLVQMQTIAGKEKLVNAEKAATDAYAWAGNPILGAVLAAGAFTAVMAFANGGLVPGSGSGDTVPAMLSPGETVVSKTLTDSVRNNTTNNKGGDVHVHTTVHAVDAAGFEGLLNKHANVVAKHVKTQLRKANR
jgi:hypothetical protein